MSFKTDIDVGPSRSGSDVVDNASQHAPVYLTSDNKEKLVELAEMRFDTTKARGNDRHVGRSIDDPSRARVVMPQGYGHETAMPSLDQRLAVPSGFSATSKLSRSGDDGTDGYNIPSTSGEASYMVGAADDEEDTGSKQAPDASDNSINKTGEWIDPAAPQQPKDFRTDDMAQEPCTSKSSLRRRNVTGTIQQVTAAFPDRTPLSGDARPSGQAASAPKAEASLFSTGVGSKLRRKPKNDRGAQDETGKSQNANASTTA